MREYVDAHPRPAQIDLNRLYASLGFTSKRIPPDLGLSYMSFPCPDFDGQKVGNFRLTILPSKYGDTRTIKHRIVIVCKCGRSIPFSRMRTHNCPYYYEWADRYPYKAVKQSGMASYHKSRETGLKGAGQYGRLYRWDRGEDGWKLISSMEDER